MLGVISGEKDTKRQREREKRQRHRDREKGCSFILPTLFQKRRRKRKKYDVKRKAIRYFVYFSLIYKCFHNFWLNYLSEKLKHKWAKSESIEAEYKI